MFGELPPGGPSVLLSTNVVYPRQEMPRVLDTHPEVVRLRKALKRLVRDSGIPMAELGAQADLNLYSILGGKQFLRAEHVYLVLDALRIEPVDFFAGLYDLRRPPDDRDLIAGISKRELLEHVRRIVGDEIEERQGRVQGEEKR